MFLFEKGLSKGLDLQVQRGQRISCWSEEAIQLSDASVGHRLRYKGLPGT